MTVSYVTYPESSGEQIYSDKQTRQNANSIYKYFIGQYVSSVLKPSGRGKRWLNEELSFYTSHINYFKTNQFSNFFDQAFFVCTLDDTFDRRQKFVRYFLLFSL
jgi:hypothetical protein